MNVQDAYFAGLFDGEGSVGIYRATNGKETQSGNQVYWTVKLSLVGTYRPMVEAACAYFAVGRVRAQKRQALIQTPSRSYTECKQGWRWSVTRRSEIQSVLTRILPFLHEKKVQVEIVLAFLSGETTGDEASVDCKEAKRFSFPLVEKEIPARSTGSPGTQNPNSKLSTYQIQLIRTRVSAGDKQAQVAREYGVSKTIVSRLIRGKTYQTP